MDAESVGDDRCRCLEDELPQRGDAGLAEGKAEPAELQEQRAVSEWLSGVLARKQPAVLRSSWRELAHQLSKWVGNGTGRIAEADEWFTVVFEKVSMGQAQDAAQWLCIEQEQAGGDADRHGFMIIGEVAAQQCEPALLDDGWADVELRPGMSGWPGR